MTIFEIVKTVRLTEKSTVLSSRFNRYTVEADPRASKIQIRDAVQKLFKVTVLKVNTLNSHGKLRRQFTKAAGQDGDWKKAVVTLKEGDKIQLT